MVEDTKAKGKDKGKQVEAVQQSNDNETKNIKSFKTLSQKTAHHDMVKVFNEYKDIFQDLLDKQD